MWAACAANADCSGHMMCWNASAVASSGVCTPSGLCIGQAAASTGRETFQAATTPVSVVESLVDRALEQNQTLVVTTVTYAVETQFRDCTGLQIPWTPPTLVNPSAQSSIAIAEFADSDICSGGGGGDTENRMVAYTIHKNAAGFSGIAVNEPGFAVSGPVFALASRDGDIEASVIRFTLDLSGVPGDFYLCAHYGVVSTGWASSGCTQEAAELLFTCQCNVSSPARVRRDIGSGGSYFTVLVGDANSAGDRSTTEEAHAGAILWVTYLGLVISVPAMLAFVYIYIRHEELRTQHRFNIANLCAVLLVLNLLFVFGINGILDLDLILTILPTFLSDVPSPHVVWHLLPSVHI